MSPPAALGMTRTPFRPAAWSLSTKLVVTVVGLFLAVTLATSSLTVVLLHNFLQAQLDKDVTASVLRDGGRWISTVTAAGPEGAAAPPEAVALPAAVAPSSASPCATGWP